MAKAPKNPQPLATGLAFNLVMTEAVDRYRIGDVVTEPSEIATVMHKYPGHFTKVAKSV